MHERKRGTLKSGQSGRKVTSRKQAIAIGLSEARRAGAKVPRKGGRTRKAGSRSADGRAGNFFSAVTHERRLRSARSSGNRYVFPCVKCLDLNGRAPYHLAIPLR